MLELTIGEFVKKRRTELNLTQAELAERINSDACYISRIETGARKITINNLVALANALDVSSDYLLGLSSNIVLHYHVSDMEKVLKSLIDEDKEAAIKLFYEFTSRCRTKD